MSRGVWGQGGTRTDLCARVCGQQRRFSWYWARCVSVGVVVFGVALVGCAQWVLVVVPPPELLKTGVGQGFPVTLAIAPEIEGGSSEVQVPYATVGSLRISVPYGRPLEQTIRRAAEASFASVRPGQQCGPGSIAFVKVEWAAAPTVSLSWDSGFQEGAVGTVEFPLRVAVFDCSGQSIWRRNVIGSYTGPGAPAGAFNVPGADDFQPILAAALQDTAAKLVNAFGTVPRPGTPAAVSSTQKGG